MFKTPSWGRGPLGELPSSFLDLLKTQALSFEGTIQAVCLQTLPLPSPTARDPAYPLAQAVTALCALRVTPSPALGQR